MIRSVPKPRFLHMRKADSMRVAMQYGAAILLATGALAGSVLLEGTHHPVALICIFAVLVSALIGGHLAGWITLAITTAGLWLTVLKNQEGDSGSGSFQSSLVLWCAYVALGVVLVEVIRHLQRERRRLLEHDQRLRLARRAARIWFWEWDLRNNLLRWSRESDQAARDHHYEIPLETYIRRRVHPEDRDLLQTRFFAAAALHHRFELDYRIIERDGTVRWLSTKGKIFEENGSNVMLGMASEITAQKQAEEVRSQFRAVLGSLIEGVCYTDTSGAIQYLNPAAEKMLGYTSDEVRGKLLHDLLHVACDSRAGSCCLRNAIVAGHPCCVQEERLTTKSGSQLIAEYTAAPVTSDGSTLGAVMMFRDISERKRAEEAVRASEKMAATGRIAATISHELRNPLDSIMQLLYLVRQSDKLGDSERQQLDLIDQELRRMTEVAQQTLAMHRQPASMVPVNLAKLIDGILLLYGKKIRSHKIEIQRRYDWQGEIPGYPAELRQVFGNLIVNAVDAMPSGGRLVLHIRHHREPVASGREGVLVSLLDSGMGIAVDVRKHLFEPFFTTKGEKGSGVGLWISGGIIQRHHGTIRVHSDSRPRRSYTCFQIFLPEKQLQVLNTQSPTQRNSAGADQKAA